MISEYKHKLLSGKPCMIHEDFIPSMDLFCRYLEICKLTFLMTSSFRTDLTGITGAVVTPAKKGNHLIGQAVDGNLIDDNKVIWTNEMMKKPSRTILQFLGLIHRCKLLRAGYYFKIPDRIHYDSGINIQNPKRWEEIYRELYQN